MASVRSSYHDGAERVIVARGPLLPYEPGYFGGFLCLSRDAQG